MLCRINHTDSLNQRICTVVEADGRNIVLYIKLRWHKKTGKWFMSLDDENEQTIIRNIPLICGTQFPTANLLRQFAYLGLGSCFVLPLVDNPSTEHPAKGNLGGEKEFALVWGDTVGE